LQIVEPQGIAPCWCGPNLCTMGNAIPGGQCLDVGGQCNVEQVIHESACLKSCDAVKVFSGGPGWGKDDDYTSEGQVLVQAARDGNVASLLQAIQSGADLDARNSLVCFRSRSGRSKDGSKSLDAPMGLTALMHASQEGHVDCVRLLCMARASVGAKAEDGMTALHMAASAASIDVAATLVWAGAERGAKDSIGLSVLGHLPLDIIHDKAELRRWRATLGFTTPVSNGDAIDKHISVKEILQRDKLHGVAAAAFPQEPFSARFEHVDSMDYTRIALESMVASLASQEPKWA